MLALIVGIPFAVRLYERSGQARHAWHDPPPVRVLPPVSDWAVPPPLLEKKSQGTWNSRGTAAYDLWPEETAAAGWEDGDEWA